MNQMANPYRWLAAINCLEKWFLVAEKCSGTNVLRAKACGLIWHDRYLCGDGESGRFEGNGPVTFNYKGFE